MSGCPRTGEGSQLTKLGHPSHQPRQAGTEPELGPSALEAEPGASALEAEPGAAGLGEPDDGAVDGGEVVRIVFTHLHNSAFVTCVGKVL
jgi:hypothetical protein